MNAVRKPAFDVEAALLGACMVDEQGYWRVADLVAAEDFAESDHRALWNAIAEASRRREPVDALTIGSKHPDLYRLALSVGSSGFAANARAYAEIVAKRATERRVRAAGERIRQLAGDDVLGEAQRILGACAPANVSAVRPISEFVRDSMRGVADRNEVADVVTGIPTGFAELDELTAGFQRGDLVVVGARPSVGKTALALQCQIRAAIHGHPGLFISLEMTGQQLTDRALAHIGRINGHHIRSPKRMQDDEWPRLTSAAAMLDGLPIMIDEASSPTVETVCARIRQCNASKRLGLVVIDYLTLMKPPKADRMDIAWQDVTRQLKQTAKDLKLPIMLLAQLNRAGAERPTLTALHEAGSLERDADVVLFLYRPDPENRNLVALDIAKQRNGAVDTLYLEANMPHMRFDVTEYTAPTDAPRTRRGGYGGRSYADRSARE